MIILPMFHLMNEPDVRTLSKHDTYTHSQSIKYSMRESESTLTLIT